MRFVSSRSQKNKRNSKQVTFQTTGKSARSISHKNVNENRDGNSPRDQRSEASRLSPAENNTRTYGTSESKGTKMHHDIYSTRKKHEERIHQLEHELDIFRNQVADVKSKGADVSELDRDYQTMIEKLEKDKQVLQEARAGNPSPDVEDGNAAISKADDTADGDTQKYAQISKWCCFSCFIFIVGVCLGWWLASHFEIMTNDTSPTPAPSLTVTPTMIPTIIPTIAPTVPTNVTTFNPTIPRYLRTFNPTISHRTEIPSSKATSAPTGDSPTITPTFTLEPTIPRYERTHNPTPSHRSTPSFLAER